MWYLFLFNGIDLIGIIEGKTQQEVIEKGLKIKHTNYYMFKSKHH